MVFGRCLFRISKGAPTLAIEFFLHFLVLSELDSNLDQGCFLSHCAQSCVMGRGCSWPHSQNLPWTLSRMRRSQSTASHTASLTSSLILSAHLFQMITTSEAFLPKLLATFFSCMLNVPKCLSFWINDEEYRSWLFIMKCSPFHCYVISIGARLLPPL